MPNSTFRLIAQFCRSPQSVGTVLPSSRELVEAMLVPVDFTKLSTIVEYGPGSGTITAEIADRLSGSSRYVGIEINRKLHEDLCIRFPHLTFVNKSAGDIETILGSFDIKQVDAIICGLPWALLPSGQQRAILDGALHCLRPGGVFVTYAFLQGLLLPGAWTLRRRLRSRFSLVRATPIVWNNVPPAFAYICTR
jgi:phospholipid N-methyltransferase